MQRDLKLKSSKTRERVSRLMEGSVRSGRVRRREDEEGLTRRRWVEKMCDQMSRWRSRLMRWPRSIGRRTAADVRSVEEAATTEVLDEGRGSGGRNFLEERDRTRQLGMTTAGSILPATPALMSPPPLSSTTTVPLGMLSANAGFQRGFNFRRCAGFCGFNVSGE